MENAIVSLLDMSKEVVASHVLTGDHGFSCLSAILSCLGAQLTLVKRNESEEHIALAVEIVTMSLAVNV